MALIGSDTIYTKTARGVLEIRNKAVKLSREATLVFHAVDGKTSVAELVGQSGLRAPQLHAAIQSLVNDGYIKAVAKPQAQPAPSRDADENLDFTSAQAMATLNMEAASRALAAADAAKRAQQEARAAMDARLREESEARARALAQTRAEAESEERAKAEEAARAAVAERSLAELAAREAADTDARTEAEARARIAAAAVVRAQAEAAVRADAEARARELAESRRTAEQAAREEAEARARSEEQAQARAAAEGRAHEAIQAQFAAMQGASAQGHSDAAEAEAARARVRELERATEHARDAARLAAEAEGRRDEVPEPPLDIADRVRQLNARVQAERRAREEAARQPRVLAQADAASNTRASAPDGGWPALELGDSGKAAPAAAPADPLPPREHAQATTVAGHRGADDLAFPSVEPDRPRPSPVSEPEHVPGPLERAIAAIAARSKAASARHASVDERPARELEAQIAGSSLAVEREIGAAPTDVPAEVVETTRTLASGATAEPRSTDDATATVVTIDDAEPLNERLNVDRTAHDIIAESLEARRQAEAPRASRAAAAAREQRLEDERRRVAAQAARKRRKRLVIGSALVLVGVPALAVAWLQFTPINGYIPDVQQALAQRLNEPVTIGTLYYKPLPVPSIVLQDVAIGRTQGIRAEALEATVLPTAALTGITSVPSVEARGVQIAPAMLGLIPAWTGGRAADAIRVDQLRVSSLTIPGSGLDNISGDVAFEPNGTLRRAELKTAKASLILTPSAEGVRVSLEATDWRIPHGPPFPFSRLIVRGLVDQRQIAAVEFTGSVAGGAIDGVLTARWPGAVSVEGDFKLENARLQDLANELASNLSARGIVSASGRYALRSDDWSSLTRSPSIEASFVAKRGELTNVDIVRAIQSGAGAASRGGRTGFGELTGVLRVEGGRYAFRNVQLKSGPLNASGTIDVEPDGQLRGRITAALASRSAGSTLLVSGTAQNPQLR